MTPTDRPMTDAETLDGIEQVLDDTVPGSSTRRGLLASAGGLLAAGAVLSLPDGAMAATDHSRGSITSVLATFEAFGVTFLSEVVRRAPGTPSAQFAPIVAAADTAEYQHLLALKGIGAKPLTTRFWIPDGAFGSGGPEVFATIATEEYIEISAYLAGVTAFTKSRNDFGARLCAEALGTEAEHRVLASSAYGMLTGSTAPPNDRGFEAFPYKSGKGAMHASSTLLGIGFGTKGKEPGAFYDFPGDPRKIGLGLSNTVPKPS